MSSAVIAPVSPASGTRRLKKKLLAKNPGVKEYNMMSDASITDFQKFQTTGAKDAGSQWCLDFKEIRARVTLEVS